MYTLMERVTAFERYFEYDVFLDETEINYSDKLFMIKIYSLESHIPRIPSKLDVYILEKKVSNEAEIKINLELLRLGVIAELRELGINNETIIEIR